MSEIFVRIQLQRDDAKALLDALIKVGAALAVEPSLTKEERNSFSELETALDEALS